MARLSNRRWNYMAFAARNPVFSEIPGLHMGLMQTHAGIGRVRDAIDAFWRGGVIGIAVARITSSLGDQPIAQATGFATEHASHHQR